MKLVSTALAPKPAHVPDALVRDFDMSHCTRADGDVHRFWKEEAQNSKPDIFWTPHHGGHWVATRAADFDVIMADTATFSNAEFVIPKGVVPKLIPLQMDPPEHTQYRKVIMPFFLPRALAPVETKAREMAVSIIDKLAPRGECEFVSEFAGSMPIVAFLTLMQLPEADLQKLRDLSSAATKTHDVEASTAAWDELGDYIRFWIKKRRDNPGDDPLSAAVFAEVDGRPISEDEIFSMSLLLLGGGLDTVAAMMSFFAHHLATHIDLQNRIRNNHDTIPHAVQELARRYGISNIARIVAKDTEFKGIAMKQGDMVLIPMSLYGLDERLHQCPMDADLDREDTTHTAWGKGNHVCVGKVLAQKELAIFLQEWTARIPEFRVKTGTMPVFSTSLINSVEELHLNWNV